MAVSVAAMFVNLPGDVISFRTITHFYKIVIILLVLLHHAHGDFVDVTDLLFIFSAWTQDTIALGFIICVKPEILKQTKWHQVEAGYPKLSAHVQREHI